MSLTWGSVSGWWLPACLVLGLLYAWLMYRQPVQLVKSIRYTLFALRAVVVSFLALLLVSPLVRSTSYQPQKPLVLIAQDNSESIKLFSKSKDIGTSVNGLARLKVELGDDYEVHEFTFDRGLYDGLTRTFDGKQTDISNALHRLNERFVNRNIGALVLATDGLYNLGTDPQYEARNIKTNIYTIALGDTVPRRDLLLSNVNYNKTAFLGNDFEVEILAEAYQSTGENMHLTITEDGRQVNAQNISITSAVFKKVIPVKLNADKKGIRRFTISLAPVKNELSVQNNTETIYIDVLDARQKVLLLYDGPHPDLSVLKQAIESNKNFEVKTSLVSDVASQKMADYSLAILYQLSATSYSKLQNLLQSKTPLWHIAGTQADLQAFNNAQKAVKINAGRQEVQEAFAQPVSTFSAFTLTDSTRDKISKLPPLVSPFGNYEASGTASVLFRQKIGNVETSYPLLAFNDEGGRKTAALTGEGLWRWQLAEYREFGNHHAVEELLSQTVQYLTANANRQRFRVYTAKNVFDEGENVLLNAELYNDALELINTPDVKINLKSQSGKNYSFLFTRAGQSYQLNAGALPMGEYTYQATAAIGKQTFTANGQITIKQLNLETRQSTANHGLLRNIAAQSGGQMLLPSQISKLADLIRKNENIKTVVYEDKRYSDLVDAKWVFVLILLLLSAEWFLRKREGEI
nr:VWA domain-containing protein [Mucilaginibacter sp. L294]